MAAIKATDQNNYMRTKFYILGFLAAAMVATGCQRENEIVEPIPPLKGGKGGRSTINVTPQHHKVNINEGMIYIKYGSNTMPAMDQFDDSGAVEFTLGRPAVTFKELTQGDYYLYATGIDYELEAGKDRVTGGAHFRVIDSLEKTYDLYLQMDDLTHHIDEED